MSIWRTPPVQTPWQPQPYRKIVPTVAVVLQYSRPDSDVSAGGWTTHTGASSPLYDQVDEAVRDDGDYIRSDQDPTNDTVILSLQPMGDPAVNTDFVVALVIEKDVTDATMNVVVTLQAGTTDVATGTFNNISDTLTEVSFTLSSGEVDTFRSNGGYADPRIKIVATQV